MFEGLDRVSLRQTISNSKSPNGFLTKMEDIANNGRCFEDHSFGYMP